VSTWAPSTPPLQRPQHLVGDRHILVTGPVEHDERVTPEVEIGVGELLGAAVGVVVLIAAVDLLNRGQQRRQRAASSGRIGRRCSTELSSGGRRATVTPRR
jgi:hypothetical protein